MAANLREIFSSLEKYLARNDIVQVELKSFFHTTFLIPCLFMSRVLAPELKKALKERIRYYNELGIYDFYKQEVSVSEPTPSEISETLITEPVFIESMTPRTKAAPQSLADLPILGPKPEQSFSDPVAALRTIREDLGDCTRCRLSQQGRKQIVFGVGNPNADLMFIGEAPGADEDEQGEPFVGRAGQLLTNMIKAMGITREDVYIANIIKCRPPGNRQPERDECETCSPFLMRQIAVIKPKAIVALGAVAAKTLLAINAPDVRAARTLVRLPRHQTRRHLPSGVSAARSPPERRSLERFADGDERAGHGSTGEGRGVRLSSVLSDDDYPSEWYTSPAYFYPVGNIEKSVEWRHLDNVDIKNLGQIRKSRVSHLAT